MEREGNMIISVRRAFWTVTNVALAFGASLLAGVALTGQALND